MGKGKWKEEGEVERGRGMKKRCRRRKEKENEMTPVGAGQMFPFWEQVILQAFSPWTVWGQEEQNYTVGGNMGTREEG